LATKPGVSYSPASLARLSNVIGWSYFVMWSVSFWPQTILNFLRRSVDGLSFDFIALNLLGFSCYSAYNCSLLFSPTVRAQYHARHDQPGKPASIPVHANDVFFGLHAVVATLVVTAQLLAYRTERHGLTRPALLFMALLLLAALGCGLATAGGAMEALDFVLALSYLKLAISVTKYVPQALLNARRRSTAGWSIHNVVLDFSGGLLSVLQLLMDCSLQRDWSGVSGNPVKFGLGFTSMVFDCIFAFQHYVLYPQPPAGGELDALLLETEEEVKGEAERHEHF
jgi:cystinosin